MYLDWPLLKRWCFCLPLRQGILIFGYLNIPYCAFMIFLFSYTFETKRISALLIIGVAMNYGRTFAVVSNLLKLSEELSIGIYSLELTFTVALLYGIHTRSVGFVKAYYYFSLTVTGVVVVLAILELVLEKGSIYLIVQLMAYALAGFCMQLYLITGVRSLQKKMEASGAKPCDQLHQILTRRANAEYSTRLINDDS